jgi:hypothetical protein
MLYEEPHLDPVNPLEILRHAMTRLTDIRNGRLYPVASRYPVMDDHDESAYRLIRWLAGRIEDATGRCQIEIVMRDGHDGGLCWREAVTFCADCGNEICRDHAVKLAWETYCTGCGMFH